MYNYIIGLFVALFFILMLGTIIPVIVSSDSISLTIIVGIVLMFFDVEVNIKCD